MKKNFLLVACLGVFLNTFSQDSPITEVKTDTVNIATTEVMSVIVKPVKSEVIVNTDVEKSKNDITTFYVINNAEKKKPTEEQKDPYLDKKGVSRSKKWADILSAVKLDAIYAINTISAKQTAQPISESQKAGVYQFDSEAMYDASFQYLTDGKNILISGNNEITTKFVNNVLGKEKYTLVENDNFGVLYIVTVSKKAKTAVALTID